MQHQIIKRMEWFESWFESPYYHILYKNRNDEEAKRFIDLLLTRLNLADNAPVLDLACGKGRHSKYLHQRGYNVVGADLSAYNISEANKHAQEGLTFIRHDMREVISGNMFDAVFNLFTSFGYFDSTDDNKRVLHAVHHELNPNGVFIIDFLNPGYVSNYLVPVESKEIDGVSFNIRKEIKDGFIYKYIEIITGGTSKTYQERVQAITQKELISMLESSNFHIVDCFGNYDLTAFQEDESPRTILIAKKNHNAS